VWGGGGGGGVETEGIECVCVWHTVWLRVESVERKERENESLEEWICQRDTEFVCVCARAKERESASTESLFLYANIHVRVCFYFVCLR